MRDMLDALPEGDCIVWVLGSPESAVSVGPHGVPDYGYQAFLGLHPQPNGAVLLFAERAGWVRRATVTQTGLRIGNMHAAHTAGLRGTFRRRDKWALAQAVE